MADIRIALFRGINVGRAKRLSMAQLRALFEALGCSGVRTVLNSGNVVFTPAADIRNNPGPRIEHALQTTLGLSARVITLTADELAAIVDGNPLLAVATNPSRLLVSVFNDPADREQLAPLLQEDWTPEALALGTRAAYLWCPEGVLASRAAAALAKVLGDGVTTRNWGTVTRIKALIAART